MNQQQNSNLGRGNIPSIAQSKTVSAFGLTPGVQKVQRNTIASSSTYKTPDFTISMNANENAGLQNNQIPAMPRSTSFAAGTTPSMDLKADTTGFKDLTSQ